MEKKSSRHPGQSITLAAVFVLLLSACDQPSFSKEAQETYHYSDLATDRAIAIDFPSVQGQASLIKVEGFETEFESQLFGSDGTLSSTARLSYLRTGPILHFVEAGIGNHPVRLTLTPKSVTGNSTLSVSLFTLATESSRSRARIQAIKDYEAATQSTDDESPGIWGRRVDQLRSAAENFARSDDGEMCLWAEFLEAYFSYFPLADKDRALDLTRKVRKQAVKNPFALVELMALQLEGQILIERDKADSPEQAAKKFEMAEKVLQLAQSRATELGMNFEKAWALNSQGIGHFNQDRFNDAERDYRQSLEIAIELQDHRLEQTVRGNLALVLEQQGDLEATLTILLDINQQLQDSGSRVELGHNWSEIGRVYRKNFQFPQAVDALSRALDLAREIHSAELIASTKSSLAHAYFGMGYLDRALESMEDAIDDMRAADYARGLRAGYRLVADIHRIRRDFSAMSAARQQQKAFLTGVATEAHFQYSLGLDALALNPPDIAAADQFFTRAQVLIANGEDEDLILLSRFYHCFIESSLGQLSSSCELTSLRDALSAWLPVATPAREFEMRFLFARILVLQGAEREAIDFLASLIDQIRRYRADLPGVLGAWYWEYRTPVFETYLLLQLGRADPDDRALESLLALNHVRNASLDFKNAAVLRDPAMPNPESQELRNFLARLESEPSDQGRLEIRQAIDQKLIELGQRGRVLSSRPDPGKLEQALLALPPDSALLSFYFSEHGSWAWLAGQKDVRLFQVDDSASTLSRVRRTREGLRTIGDDQLETDLYELGKALFSPLEQPLPRNIYLLTGGELAGFPLEVLLLNGRRVGQDHSVINVLTLEALDALDTTYDARSWTRIYLAGVQAESSAQRPQLPGTEVELNNLKKIFQDIEIYEFKKSESGSGLTLTQNFADADLIHIASHARINLEFPELSRIMLSGASGDAEGDYLTPVDIRQSSLRADLVVLSACETTGVNSFTFDSNLGFVSEFLRSGTGAVVASLWPVGDTFSRTFMQDFYSALLTGMSASEALSAVKRRYISARSTGDPLDWASFQIYIK